MKRFLFAAWLMASALICYAVPPLQITNYPARVYAGTPFKLSLQYQATDGSSLNGGSLLQYRFSSSDPYTDAAIKIDSVLEAGGGRTYMINSYILAESAPDALTLEVKIGDSQVATASLVVDAPVVLEGARLTVGYQGWFATPGDSSLNRWNHWFEGNDQNQPTQDQWPRVNEADYPDRTETELVANNGEPLYLYSNAHQSTANTHVSWMREYGLQAFFVGRFMEPFANNPRFAAFRNTVMQNMINATQDSQFGGEELKFAIFYNLTTNPNASGDTDYLEELWEDWKDVVDSKRWTSEEKYLRKDGKPVIRIYGIGFKNRPSGITAPEARDLIRRFTDPTHPEYRERYAAYLVGGVPSRWYVGGNEAYSSPEWLNVYESYDMIQPWLVNRYRDQAAVDRWMKDVMTQDLARVNELHAAGREVGYLPLIFPGFSWYNLNGVYNVAPRNGGQFYWYQAYKILNLGVDNIMIANFDEVDEGTAIYKCVVSEAQVPDPTQFSESKQFLHYNSEEPAGSNYPSDWYLRVTREIRKTMMEVTPLSPELPISVDTSLLSTSAQTQVWLQAEDFASSSIQSDQEKNAWQEAGIYSGYQDSGYVATPNNIGQPKGNNLNESARLDYTFTTEQSGTYHVWVRRYARSVGSNSAYFGIDGTALDSIDNQKMFNEWVWIKIGSLPLSEGVHSLQLARRENGYLIDAFLIDTTEDDPNLVNARNHLVAGKETLVTSSTDHELLLRVFPNPVEGTTLHIRSEGSQASQAVLFNTQGVPVAEQQLSESGRATVEVGSLPKGMYLLKVYSPQHTVVEKVLIE